MNLFDELKRRSVFRVAAAYAVVAWLILQVGDIASASLGFPAWFMPMLFVLLGLGFPVALILSWVFELTPDGVRKSADLGDDGAVRPGAGRRLDRLIVVALVAVIVVLVAGRVGSAGNVGEAGVGGSLDVALPDARQSIAVLPFAESFVCGLEGGRMNRHSELEP